jgi:hypothetical protein
MAIVHPAFCGVVRRFDGTFRQAGVTNRQVAAADTKHFKNRVYSSRTVDVFSRQVIAARQ